jgi:hypothetical protein
MVNRFIISLEIGAELILIVSVVVHHLSWDRDGGFVYVQMYLFCSYDLSSMLWGSGNHLVATRC